MTDMISLYRHFDKDDRLLYVGISGRVIARTYQHETQSHWFGDVVKVTIQYFASRKEAEDAESDSINIEKPMYNIAKKNASKKQKEKTSLMYAKKCKDSPFKEITKKEGSNCLISKNFMMSSANDLTSSGKMMMTVVAEALYRSNLGNGMIYIEFDSKKLHEDGVSRNIFYRGMGELISVGVIAKHANKRFYYVNQNIMRKSHG